MKKTKSWEFAEKIPVNIRFGFFAAVIAGYITHIFAFTNIIPNSDGISRVFDAQQMTVSGRWFLHFASYFNSFLQMPAVIGLLSVLFSALATVAVIKLLGIENPVAASLIGVILTVFPAVAYTYLYMFTASAYFFAVLLAALAVFVTAKVRFGLVPGAILLACALGTYQAYIAFAASLAIIFVIKEFFSPEKSFREVLLSGLKQLGMLAVGSLLYVVILKVFLSVKGLSLLSYQGAGDTLSDYPFSSLPSLIVKAYKGTLRTLFTTNSFSNGFFVIVNFIIFAALAAFIVRLILRRELYRTPAKLICAVVLMALLPLTVNLAQLINTTADTTPVTMYALSLFYVFFIIIASEKTVSDEKSVHIRVRAAAFALVLVAAFCSFSTDNVIYTSSATAHRATESFCTRLVERVETTPGYTADMPVYIIGGFPSETYYSDIPIFADVEHYSCQSQSVVPLCKHIYFYLNDWLNVRWEMPSEADMISMSDSAEFKEMPLYPSDGSVKIIDGAAVVRLAESYTPKSDYELAYEQRK